MNFPLSLYVAAPLAAGLVTAASLPAWRALCRRRGWVDDPGARKIHDAPVPLAGGLAILTGILLPLALVGLAAQWGWLGAMAQDRLLYGLEQRWPQLAAVLGGAVGMTLLGWWDDRVELSAARKFAGQLGIALLVAASGVRVTLFVPSAAFSFLVTVLWILTVTNALNFLDNMNGLCAGLGVIGAALFGLAAAGQDHYLVAGLAFLVAGAMAGFLPFNYPRATAFLGDAGSHLIGFLLAVLAVFPHFHSVERPRPLAVLSPLLILAVPLLDLAWVVLLRWRAGQPFYVGDTNHLSHRLVRRGLSRPAAVAVIWALAAALGALAFLL
ncbi:MAG: putative undecaprenyl-phosphate N-acetylglucosaminyl 1-phosphate transferase [Verrucomicrobiota bacterium]|jgi:UDP-GlcNAc:undecaprenyl-phosphate GlcNAc-1-phosphate transferase